MAFYVRLRKFFQQNDPDRLYLVKKIVVSFRDDEDLIMDRLEQIYKQGGPTNLKSTNSHTKSVSYNDNSNNYSSQSGDDHLSNSDNEDSISDNNNTAAPVKKSKKKLVILVLLAIVLSAGGYFGYEFFMKEAPSNEETKDENLEDPAAANESDKAIKEEPKTEEPELIVAETNDSMQSPNDTIAVNIDLESSESDGESDNE
jgi:hypothetical protein